MGERRRRSRVEPTDDWEQLAAANLKAEYPGINPNEIANAVYGRFGRCPDHKTVRRFLEEGPIPLRFVRRFPPYGEVSDTRERRFAVVALHSEGWSARAIAGYLRAHKSTVHRAIKRLAAPRRGPLAAGASGALL